MRVLVVGTGYVGLTTGVVVAYLGNQVVCPDILERLGYWYVGVGR